MTAWLVLDENDEAVSSGTVLADPLPEGLRALELTEDEERIIAAGGYWDKASQSIIEQEPAVAPPTVEETLEAAISKLDLLLSALADARSLEEVREAAAAVGGTDA